MGLPTQHLLPGTLATNHTAALTNNRISHRNPYNAVYLWKRTPGSKFLIALLATTLILVTVLTPYAMASAERRARAQWYIDDLRSQGFNIVDAGSDYYRHGGGATRIENYSDIAPTAKAISCSRIQVRCGTPTSFLFFMGDGLQLVFWAYPPNGG